MKEPIAVQILFTEDDAEELRLLREALEVRGYEVASARLGKWPGPGEGAVDCVIVLLGGSTSRGEELEALGEISAGTDNVLPVIAIASPEKAGWVEEALHWGATDQLLKDSGGVHVRMLPAVLGRALERARALEEITELRRSEAESFELQRRNLHFQRLESLGVLAGGVAHDFNNLLVAILGHADLAMSTLEPGSPLVRDLAPIIEGAEQAADLCQQMLAFAGQGPMTLEEVDLGHLIAQMKDLLSSSLPGRVRLELDAPTDIATIQADPTQMQQVVMNLLLNAGEAIGDSAGTVTISIAVEVCDDEFLTQSDLEDHPSPGSYAVLSVTDTGCGMSEEVRGRLFEPFFSTKFTGRGLGSSAILGIARSHGGTVLVETEVERGSTVRVLFPVFGSDGSEEGTSSKSTAFAMREQAGSGFVLVVDDEGRVRDLAGAVLEQGGFSVLSAADGQAGVELFEAHHEELVCVLLDLSMPDLGGDEVLVEMRRIDPDVPVILSSGYDVDEAMARLSGPEPDAFIQKPYRVGPLLEAIQEAVKTS